MFNPEMTLIGGSMETGSYLLPGQTTESETFFSTAHGSGGTMSRKQAKKQFRGRELEKDMERHCIYARSASCAGQEKEAKQLSN